VVVHQFASVHDPPDLGAELGVVLDVPAQDVTDTDLHQVEIAGEHGALGALATPLDPHDHVFPHLLTMPRWRPAHGRPPPAGGPWVPSPRPGPPMLPYLRPAPPCLGGGPPLGGPDHQVAAHTRAGRSSAVTRYFLSGFHLFSGFPPRCANRCRHRAGPDASGE